LIHIDVGAHLNESIASDESSGNMVRTYTCTSTAYEGCEIPYICFTLMIDVGAHLNESIAR
jgi:hypothetical protein